MVIICPFATDITCLIVEHIYWSLNLYFRGPLLCFLQTLHFLWRRSSVLSPWNGKNLDAAVRLLFSPLMSRCGALCSTGLCVACRKGPCSHPMPCRVPMPCPCAARLAVQTARGCVGALAFLRRSFCEETLARPSSL